MTFLAAAAAEAGGGTPESPLLGYAAILTAVLTFIGGIYAVRKTRSVAKTAEDNTHRLGRAETTVHDTVVRSASAAGKADALGTVVNNLTGIITTLSQQNAVNSVRIDKCESERDHLREEVGDLRRMVHAGIWAAVRPNEPPPT